MPRPSLRDAAPPVCVDDARAHRDPTGTRLDADNRSRAHAIVEDLTRITAAMADGTGTASADILEVADRIADLRTALTFTHLVSGL